MPDETIQAYTLTEADDNLAQQVDLIKEEALSKTVASPWRDIWEPFSTAWLAWLAEYQKSNIPFNHPRILRIRSRVKEFSRWINPSLEKEKARDYLRSDWEAVKAPFTDQIDKVVETLYSAIREVGRVADVGLSFMEGVAKALPFIIIAVVLVLLLIWFKKIKTGVGVVKAVIPK